MTLTLLENIKIPWLRGKQKPALAPDDLKEIQRGVETTSDNANLDYFWFEVEEKENGKTYKGFRVVRLLELRFIPLDARADSGLLQKMRSVLRSLYGSKVSFLCLTGGLFTNPAVGIIQCYGVSVFCNTLEEAADNSKQALFVLKSAMASAYRQMKLEPLNTETGAWIFASLARMNHALVVVGQPDPRENAKGGGQALFSNPLTAGDMNAQQYSMQQNEILFRGMSTLKEDFLFMVMTSPISLSNISEMLIGLAEVTSSWASWQSGMRGASFGISLPAFLSGALVDSTAQGTGTSEATAHSDGVAHSDALAHSEGSAHTEGMANTSGWSKVVTDGVAVTDGVTNSQSTTISDGSAQTESAIQGTSESLSNSQNVSNSVGASANAGVPGVVGVGVEASHGWGSGSAASAGSSESSGVADTVSHGVAVSSGQAALHSETQSHSESVGVSGSSTKSSSDTVSESDTVGQSDTMSQSDTLSKGVSANNMIGHGVSSGLSVGLAPSFSINNSYQWQFDPAILVTQILRTQQRLLEVASKEGAFYCDTYAFTKTEQGKKAMMGLVPESFHGTEDVVTGVQTRDLTPEEEQYILRHAQVFSPSTRIETVPEVMSGYMDSTLLTLLQVAAYTAPGMYEMGTATTVQEATPDFAYYPRMNGDAILGKQWSSELGELTDIPLRLSPDRHFHTAFCGDTGFGKSVSAERVAYETTLKWHYRTIVLDFGQGWRRALNWSGLEGRVDIRQIYPGAQRPLRWNILQVPKRMNAGQYRSMFAELFANAGQMGPRQLGFLRRAITANYEANGVLLTDKKKSDEMDFSSWHYIRDEAEVKAVQDRRAELDVNKNAPYSAVALKTPLSILSTVDQQAIAVHRSKKCSIKNVVKNIRAQQEQLGKNDQTSKTSIEGLLLRVETFEDAEMLRQYGEGPDSLPIEDLGLRGDPKDPWGMAVIEGGAEMSDEFSKVAILSLLASVLYFDAISRRRESLAGVEFPPMQIFFEEANKILTGVGAGHSASDSTGSASSSVGEIFQAMWRDGRKYKIFLHLMVQTVSQLPEGIMSSCNNLFCVQTKNAKDRDMVMSHIGRSEKGFVNTEYKRYLARIPIKMALVKLGYSDDVTQLEPILVSPSLVPGEEPSDTYIAKFLAGVK